MMIAITTTAPMAAGIARLSTGAPAVPSRSMASSDAGRGGGVAERRRAVVPSAATRGPRRGCGGGHLRGEVGRELVDDAAGDVLA
jgi:hypothetical protein